MVYTGKTNNKKYKKIEFLYLDTGIISEALMDKTISERGLLEYVNSIVSLQPSWYETGYASFALPYDQQILADVQCVVNDKKRYYPSVLIVIGIGGSALGAQAIYQAIKGSFFHTTEQMPMVYFLQTIDSDHVATLLTIIEQECKKNNTVIINVITKSGTTVETIVNFEVVIALLKKYRPHDYHKLVVVTSDSGSPLHMHALENNYSFLSIAKNVGGRFSVFSAVGLFPLLLAGVDVEQLLAGARDALDFSLAFDSTKNHALQSALLLYLHYRQGVTIHDMFLFSVDLEVVGKWYRQLMGESIGKEFDIHGNRVYAGITPTVSLGTIDLHSVAQLYLGGPKDKYTTFVAVDSGCQDIGVSSTGLSGLSDKKLSSIMKAFLQGTQRAYQNNGRPFSTLILPEKNEYYLGQCMQYKMVEMVFLAYLLEVDPFDQPNVDLYKREVKKLLF